MAIPTILKIFLVLNDSSLWRTQKNQHMKWFWRKLKFSVYQYKATFIWFYNFCSLFLRLLEVYLMEAEVYLKYHLIYLIHLFEGHNKISVWSDFDGSWSLVYISIRPHLFDFIIFFAIFNVTWSMLGRSWSLLEASSHWYYANVLYFKADLIHPPLMQLWCRDITNHGPVRSLPFNGEWFDLL